MVATYNEEWKIWIIEAAHPNIFKGEFCDGSGPHLKYVQQYLANRSDVLVPK
jgi:hypothetical protein